MLSSNPDGRMHSRGLLSPQGLLSVFPPDLDATASRFLCNELQKAVPLPH